MKDSIFLGIIQNIALLLAFSMLYDYFWSRNDNVKKLIFQIITGTVLGGTGIILILTPWTLLPGIIFDTRSVILSISGLFFGFVPTIVATIIIGFYRLYIGGPGTLMGITVIISSGTIGMMWRWFRPDWNKKNYFLELAGMGILVHVIMLGCIMLLPDENRLETFNNIAIPVLFLYPVATVLLGVLMLHQTENWKNRKKLNISEERWHFALEGAGDGVWDWNMETDEIYYSKQWKFMLGFDDSEIDNKLEEWDKRIFPEDREHANTLLSQYLKGEIPAYISEYRLLCKNGEYKWILDRGKIMTRDENGKPLRVIGTHTDISGRKKDQEKIKKLNEELEQKVLTRTQELETRTRELADNEKALLNLVEDLNLKSEELKRSTENLQSANKELEAFAYTVSHDLRAPLRAIDGFTHVLTEDYAKLLNEDGKKVCRIISENAVKMSQLIDDLLAFSKLGRSDMNFYPVNMAIIVENVLNDIITEENRKRVKLTLEPLPVVVADHAMMKQVWINLLTNAIKFTGKISNPEINIKCKEKQSEYIFSIEDNGIGFDMKYADRLFGVFQRFHSAKEFEGTGVGLAIVQRIVQRHGGRVWAEAEENNGAKFFFTIPRV